MTLGPVRFYLPLVIMLSIIPVAYADSGPDHQTVQPWPIQLGTSGGNINDISKLYCCSGTLGGLVEDSSGTQYILSNNHVIARSNLGIPGDEISQPGMIDQQCRNSGVLANLAAFVPIKFKSKRSVPLNEADAAIALPLTGAVDPSGSILDIGPLSANIVAAAVGMAVQKSGRTTGHTFGSVAAINVTVDVGYSKACGGAATQVARYINQIRVTPGSFSAGGDSGSVIVESGAADPADGLPRPVGLLFAGSSTSTLANPMNRVLALLGVAMTSAPAAASSAPASAAVTTATAAKARHSAALFAVPGVIGHGVGLSAAGRPVIEVYLAQDNASARARIPAALDNVPVQVIVTGEFIAF